LGRSIRIGETETLIEFSFVLVCLASFSSSGWAQKNTNLFVGDLDPTITTEQLREAFKYVLMRFFFFFLQMFHEDRHDLVSGFSYRPFGPIVEEETFVKQLNYGFVKFKHRAHAEKAKREMDGKLLGSRYKLFICLLASSIIIASLQ